LSEPRSETELLQRADACAGRTLAELAARLGEPVPADLTRHKGWAGSLIEKALGIQAHGRAGPDLPHLSIEVKSIPVDPTGKPRESTWVCLAPVDGFDPGPWRTSPVRAKLAHVLWMPILDAPTLAERRVGVPFLWMPSAEEEEVLARDWEALSELLAEGEVSQWHARHGEALQLRPKAARADDRIWVVDADGEWVQTNPRGFYLRSRFTAAILARESRLVFP
jgi:DNA mismatch repair protein MutH